jgi:ketohexokinase
VRVLGVGIATLDVVNEVEGYPAEDAEVRALAQRVSRGGNATNTLAALAQLGHRCSWAGMLADDRAAELVRAELHALGVATDHVRRQRGGTTPTSYVTLSRTNGSRTIVHYRALDEYPAAAFATIALADFDWVHFEGRAVPELDAMLRHLRAAGGPRCSLEVEKPRPGIEALLTRADLVMFGRAYVEALGYAEPVAFLHDQPQGLAAVCGWGDAGAWGRSADGSVHHAAACPPPQVLDTLGAGDVFNAAVIDAWLGGRTLAEALAAGCRLAGAKCGRRGLTDLLDGGTG